MNRDLLDSLHAIEAGLTRLGRNETLRRLRPGRPPLPVGAELPSEVARVYAWHDGTDTTEALLDDLHASWHEASARLDIDLPAS